MEQLLTESADALFVFRLDLTENTHSREHGLPPKIAEACRNSSVDELFRVFGTVISRQQEAEEFRETLNRENLLKAFAEQKKQVSLKIHLRIKNGETHLIHIFVNMLKNPAAGDIEAIVYSVDIDRQEKEEKVISAVTNREYDFIALIGAESGTIHYQYTSSKSDTSIHLPLGDYDDAVSSIAGSLHAGPVIVACGNGFAQSDRDVLEFEHERLPAAQHPDADVQTGQWYMMPSTSSTETRRVITFIRLNMDLNPSVAPIIRFSLP